MASILCFRCYHRPHGTLSSRISGLVARLTFPQFGKPLGFLEQGFDIADIMATIHGYSRYGAVVGVFSEWHPAIFRVLQLMTPKGEVGIAYIHGFAGRAIAEWHQRPEREKARDQEKSQGSALLESSFLSSLLAKHRKTPEQFGINDIYYHVLPNIIAGAETTGISLSATVYFLSKNPKVLQKLRRELEGVEQGNGARVSIKQAQSCQYLQAVTKESLRLFPPTGLGFPRVVTSGGLTLAGRFFPEGVSLSSLLQSANAIDRILWPLYLPLERLIQVEKKTKSVL